MAGGRRDGACRLGLERRRTFTIAGRPICHRLYRPHEANAELFADNFALRRAYSFEALRSPATLRRFPSAAARLLGLLERTLGCRRPFVNWGRFFVLDLERRPGL